MIDVNWKIYSSRWLCNLFIKERLILIDEKISGILSEKEQWTHLVFVGLPQNSKKSCEKFYRYTNTCKMQLKKLTITQKLIRREQFRLTGNCKFRGTYPASKTNSPMIHKSTECSILTSIQSNKIWIFNAQIRHENEFTWRTWHTPYSLSGSHVQLTDSQQTHHFIIFSRSVSA